ncbi:unnamed protein product [Phytophthora fragariaefolia]|uniref:Unnamed protein product n=1 Tax=Phytophthora fragariaefolia TaxID=1490495 RepID=A0A9W6WXA0_9STRA|nr:unnamed protein product [Phytophthora fragariaefolia]
MPHGQVHHVPEKAEPRDGPGHDVAGLVQVNDHDGVFHRERLVEQVEPQQRRADRADDADVGEREGPDATRAVVVDDPHDRSQEEELAAHDAGEHTERDARDDRELLGAGHGRGRGPRAATRGGEVQRVLGVVDEEAQQRQQRRAVEDEGEGLEARAQQLHGQRRALVRARHADQHAAREDEHGAHEVVGREPLVRQQHGPDERVPADGEPRHGRQQRLRGEAVGQRAERRVQHEHGEEARVEVGAAQAARAARGRDAAARALLGRLLLLALVVRELEQQLAGDAEDARDGREQQPQRPADEPHDEQLAK